MLSTEDFAAFAKDVVPFLHVTSRVPGRKDDDLLRRVGGSGFPTLLVLGADGRVVARPAGRSVAAFEAAIEQAREHADRRAKRRAAADRKLGDLLGSKPEERDKPTAAPAGAAAFLRELELVDFTDPDAWTPRYREHRAALTGAQRARVERKLALGELQKYYMPANRAELGSAEFEHAVARLFAARRKLGGELPAGALANRAVLGLMRWAEHNEDPVLFADLLDELKRVRRGLPTTGAGAAFVAQQEQRLERLWRGLPPPKTGGGPGPGRRR